MNVKSILRSAGFMPPIGHTDLAYLTYNTHINSKYQRPLVRTGDLCFSSLIGTLHCCLHCFAFESSLHNLSSGIEDKLCKQAMTFIDYFSSYSDTLSTN